MTSRRSRLKAVTNLPVRRKTHTLQGSAHEISSADDISSEKTHSCGSKTDETVVQSFNSFLNHTTERNINDSSNKNNENEHVIVVNCSDGLKNNSDFIKENVISKNDELNNLETLENSANITKACNFLIYKTDNCNSSVFKGNICFKSNSNSSSTKDRSGVKTCRKSKEKEIPEEQNYVAVNNNNNNNSIHDNNDNKNNSSSSTDNNIVEDGFKCYTVLTPQSVTFSSLDEYTITPLTPCVNSYIDTTVTDVSSLQEYEEVQIYSEVEPTELYINNDVDNNHDSQIETDCLEPVLTSLTNCNNEQGSINTINLESLNSDVGEPKNVSKNLVSKAIIKNHSLNSITSFTGKGEQRNNLVSQARDSCILENTGSLSSQNISSDFNSFKQNMPTFRRKKSKFNDFTKKLADAKRKFQKKYEKTKPDRSTLKMIDLIFYNPATNPMESKARLEKKDTIIAPSSDVINEFLAEEKIDEPELMDCNSRSNVSDNGENESINKMPVPQVKVGLDGEIILDEKSLIIETTDAKKGREGLQNSVTVFEDNECKVSYYRGKSKKTKDWADFETKRFYKALNTIGTDFTLMQKYFPKRSRLELKNKFKREERMNRTLIDRALNNPSEFDMTQLEKDLAIEKEAEEEEIETRLCKIVKQTVKKPKMKSSLLSREMIESDGEYQNILSKLPDGNSKRLSESEKNKREREFDFVFQKLLMKESEKLHDKLPEISSSCPNTFKNLGVT